VTGPGQLLSLDAGGASAAPPSGFTQREGVLARVSSGSGTGLSPVWRLRRARDYAYAVPESQLDALVAAGYAKEAIAFYAAARPRRCLTPVFRFQRGRVIPARDAPGRCGPDGSCYGWAFVSSRSSKLIVTGAAITDEDR
jgi:hypothetical protein